MQTTSLVGDSWSLQNLANSDVSHSTPTDWTLNGRYGNHRSLILGAGGRSLGFLLRCRSRISLNLGGKGAPQRAFWVSHFCCRA